MAIWGWMLIAGVPAGLVGFGIGWWKGYAEAIDEYEGDADE